MTLVAMMALAALPVQGLVLAVPGMKQLLWTAQTRVQAAPLSAQVLGLMLTQALT